MFSKLFGKNSTGKKQRRYLVYKNRFNEVKPYEIEILVSLGQTLEVFDVIAQKDKTFVKDNILGEYASFAEAKNQSILKQKKYEVKTPVKIGANMGNPLAKPELCFTGFKKAEKTELITMAEAKGFFVRSDVSTSLTALICGDNAGPSKMKRAESAGAVIINGRESYLSFLQTGELN